MYNKDETFEIYADLSVVKSLETTDERWIVEGIASTSHLDLVGDVVLPENFIKHLDFFLDKGKIFYNHGYIKPEDTDGRTPIGHPLEAKLTDEGLYIKCALNKEHPIAQKIWKETFTNPDPIFRNQIGMSIGAKPVGEIKRVWKSDVQKFVNYLPDLILYEVSLTSKPVNENTRTWANVYKSMMDGMDSMQENSATNPVDSIELTVEQKDLTNDVDNNLIVIKSNFTDGEGNVFEVVLPINKEVLKAIMEDDNKKPLEDTDAPAAPGADDAATPPAADDAAPMTPDAPADAGAGADAPASPDAPMDMGDSPLDGATNPDEAPATNPDGTPADDTAPQGDASIGMLNDKFDTLLDMFQAMKDDLAKIIGGSNTDAQVTPPATPDIAPTEMLKSFKDEMVTLMTSAFDNINKTIVENQVLVTKSFDEVKKGKDNADGLALASIMLEDGTSVSLQKSVDEPTAEDLTKDLKLKSLVEDFRNIIGARPGDIQKRTTIFQKVRVELGMDANEFRKLVNSK